MSLQINFWISGLLETWIMQLEHEMLEPRACASVCSVNFKHCLEQLRQIISTLDKRYSGLCMPTLASNQQITSSRGGTGSEPALVLSRAVCKEENSGLMWFVRWALIEITTWTTLDFALLLQRLWHANDAQLSAKSIHGATWLCHTTHPPPSDGLQAHAQPSVLPDDGLPLPQVPLPAQQSDERNDQLWGSNWATLCDTED